jgi:hypothetical protein
MTAPALLTFALGEIVTDVALAALFCAYQSSTAVLSPVSIARAAFT